MSLVVYLSGEIHTDWREIIIDRCNQMGLDIEFNYPVLNHELSDDCGVKLLGPEESKFWHDHKGAKLNALRTHTALKNCDVVVVRFGEKYKQWNAAFDAGFAVASNIPLIVLHGDDHQHALKEVDSSALVVTDDPKKVASALNYVMTGRL